MMQFLRLFTAAAVLSSATWAQTGGPILAQQPALSANSIVFVFAGDLWTVGRSGGEARRLTSAPGLEADPYFSPDGRFVAFTGQYDGNTDVFVVPAGGGTPKRLTWHPAPDQAAGWTPDGKRVLFNSPRNSYSLYNELYTASVEGGLEERLPLPMGYEGSYSPDSSRLAYVPLSRAFNAWKRYRGGLATPIWIANLVDSKVEKVPREGSNDFNPMWVGDKVYFLSDREKNYKVTLFSYDTKSKKTTRVVENTGLDFKSASAGPGAIVIEQFGQILLLDTKTSKLSPIPLSVAGDVSEIRPKLVNVGSRLASGHLSPSGARAVFSARGEIITVPAEKGDARNLTETPGVMERDPIWSPDGKWIAYFSDESGEYELHWKDSMGKGEAQKLRLEEKPTFYSTPRWSPDSKKIAYTDAHLNAWYVDLSEKKPVLIDKDRYWPAFLSNSLTWSPDSKWIAYRKRLKNYLGAIFVYSLQSKQAKQLTDGLSDANHPVFDREGKYLYFSASTNSGPRLEPDILSIGKSETRSLYLAVLSKSEPSPFAPESDEEKVAPETPKPPPGPPPSAAVKEVLIDFEKIGQRILAMPLPPRNYAGLQAGKPGTLIALESAGPGLTVHRHDLKLRKSDILSSGVRFFEISGNGEKMLTAQGPSWSIQPLRPMMPGGAPAGPGPAMAAPPGAGSSAGSGAVLRVQDLQVRSDPKAEWAQMYRDAWRIQREFFYDPNLHGVNFADFSKKYEKFLANIQSRRDLNYLFSEMMGELTAGHLSVFGGDQPDVKSVSTGLLGCDYKIENGRYRIIKIYDGENWNPEVRAPLTQPGIVVNEGDYLLSINGRDLTSKENVYSYFEATAGKSLLLRVGPNADGSGSREVSVVPVGSEARLRNLAWIEENRRKVDQLSNGRVAYIYMPDTSLGGLTNFTRYFYAQVGKEAAIVDERFNAGGLLATDIMELLTRKRMSAVATRDGEDEVQPQGAIFGPKVMLINEFAGSGGDAMPTYFRRASVGKLVGKRTWGGLIGRAGAPSLLDGGIVTAPSSGVWGPNSQWDAENVGVPPDVEVDQDPEAVRQGKDPQLEKALELVMAELAKSPVAAPKRPAYPNYHKP